MQITQNTAAIVTGAASGLGEATARALAGKGAKVAILDRDAERGEQVASAIGGVFCQTDVTSDDSVAAALEKARAAHGQERICVNCAGIAPASKTVGKDGPHPMALFQQVIDVNLVGTMRVMSRSAAGMAQAEPLDGQGERGIVVNTASVAAYEGQIGQAAYAASKGGIVGLTLPAARDLARTGVRVMAIAPGIFGTPMLRGLPEDVQDSLAQQVPFPVRLGEPEEFGALVCFMAETSYMNGTVIRLDGAIRMGMK
ncbi:MAG: SDR family oxidoreductase [Neomegalonema sp.]|nr:SDR family oxidoreductase [Neomegalonema sp.]